MWRTGSRRPWPAPARLNSTCSCEQAWGWAVGAGLSALRSLQVRDPRGALQGVTNCHCESEGVLSVCRFSWNAGMHAD